MTRDEYNLLVSSYKTALAYWGIDVMKTYMLLLGVLIVTVGNTVRGDDSATIVALLEQGAQRGGLVTIPPGDYQLDGKTPLKLVSGMTVSAYGARFHFVLKMD